MQETTPKQHIQQFYSPLIIVFGVAVVIITLLVVLLILQGATVTVTLKGSPDKYAFSYSAAELDGNEVSADVTDIYSYSGFTAADAVKDGVATGTVTLTNNYSVNQPLVKTTRLLSTGGVLFRLSKDVVVPAGETINTEVYADQAGVSGNIAASHFEIVALNASLKPKIYADSVSTMTGGVIGSSPITQEIIDQAKTTASEAIIDKAISALEDQMGAGTTLKPNDVIVSVTNQTTTPNIGDISTTISVTTVATAKTITVKPAKLRNIITHDTGVDITSDSIPYSVSQSDTGILEITGKVDLAGAAENLNFIDTKKLINKTPTEVANYVRSFPLVKDVNVSLFPFWLTTTPSDPTKITLTAVTAPTK